MIGVISTGQLASVQAFWIKSHSAHDVHGSGRHLEFEQGVVCRNLNPCTSMSNFGLCLLQGTPWNRNLLKLENALSAMINFPNLAGNVPFHGPYRCLNEIAM